MDLSKNYAQALREQLQSTSIESKDFVFAASFYLQDWLNAPRMLNSFQCDIQRWVFHAEHWTPTCVWFSTFGLFKSTRSTCTLIFYIYNLYLNVWNTHLIQPTKSLAMNITWWNKMTKMVHLSFLTVNVKVLCLSQGKIICQLHFHKCKSDTISKWKGLCSSSVCRSTK